ncbi:VASt domain-containing protein [Haematococcus lacustris]|uniref:VASt domain-containing protein n=1 Tax=Haematococcus lacustris TaxID=44745 RepID=A0A699ZEN6_HAELA|nr:VASt domain-containing protein [Haematococcus lacustris]
MQLESRANSTSAIPPLTPIAPSHHGTDSLDCRDQQRPSATGDSGSGWRLPSGSQILPGWLSRVMSRSEELSNWFGIPGTEGRMYVFDHYLCFHSNVFGFSKKKVINFEDVVGVRKKSHFRFPNSIEVRTFLAASAGTITTVAAASASAVGTKPSSFPNCHAPMHPGEGALHMHCKLMWHGCQPFMWRAYKPLSQGHAAPSH